MREIKFDVILWDGHDPETIEHYTFEDALGEGFVEFKNGTLVPADCTVIVRQYTGLKDKNGKEIYEGDLLLNKNCNNYYVRPVTVMFEDGSFCFNDSGCPTCDEFLGNLLLNTDFEVIGNIYENPELLEGKE